MPRLLSLLFSVCLTLSTSGLAFSMELAALSLEQRTSQNYMQSLLIQRPTWTHASTAEQHGLSYVCAGLGPFQLGSSVPPRIHKTPSEISSHSSQTVQSIPTKRVRIKCTLLVVSHNALCYVQGICILII